MGSLRLFIPHHPFPAEARVARKLVREALARGFDISVRPMDGDADWTVRRTRSLRALSEALSYCDEEVVRLTHPEGKRVSFLLVWGNNPDGSELISDFTSSDVADEIYRAVYNE